MPSPFPREVELPMELARAASRCRRRTRRCPARARGPSEAPRRCARRPGVVSVLILPSLPHVSLHPRHDVDPYAEGGLRGIVLELQGEAGGRPRPAEHRGGLGLRHRAVRREVLEHLPDPAFGQSAPASSTLLRELYCGRRGSRAIDASRRGDRETAVEHARGPRPPRPSDGRSRPAPARRPARRGGRRARTARRPSRRSSPPIAGARHASGRARPALRRRPGRGAPSSISLTPPKSKRLLCEAPRPGLDAVHAGDASRAARPARRTSWTLPPAAVRWTSVSTGITRSCRLLPPWTKPIARRPGVEDRRRSRGTSGAARHVGPRNRGPRAGPAPRRRGRRRTARRRAAACGSTLRPWAWAGCGALVEQEEPVVGGEDEPAHARVAEHRHAARSFCSTWSNTAGPTPCSPASVDLVAVHDDQPAPATDCFRLVASRAHHLLEREPRAGRAADPVVHGPLAGLRVGHPELTRREARDTVPSAVAGTAAGRCRRPARARSCPPPSTVGSSASRARSCDGGRRRVRERR